MEKGSGEPRIHDWAQVRERLLRVSKEKPAYFSSEFVKALDDNEFDEKWWDDFISRTHALDFPKESLVAGSPINVSGKKLFEVVSPIGDKSQVIRVKDVQGSDKVLKRLPTEDLVDFFLNARELEESGIDACPNARIMRIDNPWVDTVLYDYIPGMDLYDYLRDKKVGVSRYKRFQNALGYFYEVIEPLAQGRLLTNGRAFLPGDFNPWGVIVSNPEATKPKFSLIDLEGSVQVGPVSQDRIQRARERLTAD